MAKRGRGGLSVQLLAIALLAACSSSSGGEDGSSNQDASTTDGGPSSDAGPRAMCDPSFGQTSGCGGDPTGSWTYLTACGNTSFQDGIQQACKNATFQASSQSAEGTLTLSAGNMYSVALTDHAMVQMTIPSDCTQQFGGCQGLASALTNQYNVVTTCSMSGSDCACTAQPIVQSNESGTYMTKNGALTTMPSGGATGSTYLYCVQGGTFRYRRMGDSTVFVLGH